MKFDDSIETPLLSRSQREQVCRSMLEEAVDKLFTDTEPWVEAKKALESGEPIRGIPRDKILAIGFKQLMKGEDKCLREVTESVCRLEPLDADTALIIHEYCIKQITNITNEVKDLKSKRRKEWAKRVLVACMNFQLPYYSSVEKCIKDLPPDMLQILNDVGFKTEDDATVRRLFCRADKELNQGHVQFLNIERKKDYKWLRDKHSLTESQCAKVFEEMYDKST